MSGWPLAKDAIATIVLDPRGDEAIATIWQETDETREQAAVRCGYSVEQVPQLRFIRWLTPAEAKIAPKPHWDEPLAGPPVEANRAAPDPESVLDRAAKEHETRKRYEAAIEEQRRADINERIVAANRLFGRSIA